MSGVGRALKLVVANAHFTGEKLLPDFIPENVLKDLLATMRSRSVSITLKELWPNTTKLKLQI